MDILLSVERPEKLYGAFGDIGNHPLGEIPTSEGLARACTHWLELWMKNKTPMDLVYKLRDLEESVIHGELTFIQMSSIRIWGL